MTLQTQTEDTYILFQVAGATYAVPSEDIQQLEMIGDITPVPNAPPAVEGVVSVRGVVIPVLSLRARFGFARAEYNASSRLIVVRRDGRVVGLTVDVAREFAHIPRELIQDPPAGVAETTGKYLDGIAHVRDRLVLILNVSALLVIEHDFFVTSAGTMPADS